MTGPSPERSALPEQADLESLVGLRSVKGSHYAALRGVEAVQQFGAEGQEGDDVLV